MGGRAPALYAVCRSAQPGPGNYLQKWGYHTAFFHGGPNGTMFLDAYARQTGFAAYYGRSEYPFPGGPLPIHRSIQYADWALRRFFERIDTMAWAKRTLFVLTADHSGPSDEPYQSTRTFWVPIAFYHPGKALSPIDSLGSHMNIVPTILEAIGYPYEVKVWGQSLWRFPEGHWVPMKSLPLYYEVLGREAVIRYPLTQAPIAVAWQGMPWSQGAVLDTLPAWLSEWESCLASYGAYISPSMGRTRISSTTVPGGR